MISTQNADNDFIRCVVAELRISIADIRQASDEMLDKYIDEYCDRLMLKSEYLK